MAPVLLDTSGLYEAADRRAPRYATCRDVFRELLARPAGLLTTEVLLAETHALVLSRVGPDGRALASRAADSLAEDRGRPGRCGVARRRPILSSVSCPNRTYSLADAISFVVMWQRSMSTAFTLDADFAAEGFTILPGRT